MSMESAYNYHCLDSYEYMRQFDVEMTYRLNSTIPLQYLREGHVTDFKLPLVPFEDKRACARETSCMQRTQCASGLAPCFLSLLTRAPFSRRVRRACR